jgi:hypothetical protein
MIYHHSNIRSFLSHYLACASLIVLTLWVILDVIFVNLLGVCSTHTAAKAAAPAFECHVLSYHIHSARLKWFDTQYSPSAFLGRAFKVWDEARHNIDGLCGKPFGGAAAKAHCGETTAIGYAENVSLLLFYIWGPLWMVWQVLRRMFVKKPQTYANNY